MNSTLIGCKLYRESGLCHCGLYGNATDEIKKKIVKKVKEKNGSCPCNFMADETNYCYNWEEKYKELWGDN